MCRLIRLDAMYCILFSTTMADLTMGGVATKFEHDKCLLRVLWATYCIEYVACHSIVKNRRASVRPAIYPPPWWTIVRFRPTSEMLVYFCHLRRTSWKSCFVEKANVRGYWLMRMSNLRWYRQVAITHKHCTVNDTNLNYHQITKTNIQNTRNWYIGMKIY